MYKKILQKIWKILSVMISIVFWVFIAAYILMLLWSVLDIQSFFGTNLEEIMKFRLHLLLMWLVVCLISIFSNKKILMLVWMIAWWYMESFFMIFSEYDYYVQKENCLDSGYVWDYNEKRCRQDCDKWDKEHGCLNETAKNK